MMLDCERLTQRTVWSLLIAARLSDICHQYYTNPRIEAPIPRALQEYVSGSSDINSLFWIMRLRRVVAQKNAIRGYVSRELELCT